MSFLKRLLSTLILAPVVLYILYQGGLAFNIMVGIMGLVAIYEFYGLAKPENKGCQWGLFFIGGVYVCLAVYALYDLRHSFGYVLVGIVLVGVWASDIGGYIFGKLIGGRKLCPTISPNKTWAGLIGACLFPLFILDGYFAIFASHLSVREVFAWAFGTSIMIGLLGQAGDLSISMLKRRVGLKDTGNLIPGHGGILDRIDALLLVIICVWILLTLKVVVWDVDLLVF